MNYGHKKNEPEELSRMPEDQEITISRLLVANLPPQFQEKGLIGHGGMGVVIRAYDNYLNREVAVKLLLFDGANQGEIQERFEREAKALALLDHPNIVKLLNWGVSTAGHPYHVLEYLSGETLSAMIERNGRLTPLQFHQILVQVLKGLAHAHQSKIVHRDLKPNNIMVQKESDGNFSVKIIDFGIARIEDIEKVDASTMTLTLTKNILGSPAYISPEQCKGGRANQLSDIYSLGCVMYQSLTGKLPFEAISAMDVMYKHINSDWQHLSTILVQPEFKRLADLVDQCLAKDPEKRPQSALIVAQVLNESLAAQLETGKIFRVRAETKKSTTRIPLICAAGVALLMVATLTVMFKPSPNSALTEHGNSKDSISSSQARRDAQTERNMLNQLMSIEIALKASSDPAKKKQLAFDFISSARKIATRQCAHTNWTEAEKTLLRIFPVTKYTDEPPIVESVTWRELAYTRLNRKDYHGAIAAADQGLDILRKSGNGDGENAAAVIYVRIQTYIKSNDLTSAKRDYELMTNDWLNGDTHPSGKLAGVALETRLDHTMDIFNSLSSIKITTNEQRLKALDFLNSLCRYFIATGRTNKAERLIFTIRKLLQQIPEDTSGFREIAATSYQNLERLADIAGSTDDAKRYRQMQKQLQGST